MEAAYRKKFSFIVMSIRISIFNNETMRKIMNAIFDWITVILLFLIGGVPSIILTLSVPVMIGWKFYRKIKYGYSLYQ